MQIENHIFNQLHLKIKQDIKKSGGRIIPIYGQPTQIDFTGLETEDQKNLNRCIERNIKKINKLKLGYVVGIYNIKQQKCYYVGRDGRLIQTKKDFKIFTKEEAHQYRNTWKTRRGKRRRKNKHLFICKCWFNTKPNNYYGSEVKKVFQEFTKLNSFQFIEYI